MEMTNNGELKVDNTPRVYPTVEDGTWETEYKGFKPFSEDTPWGHKEGVRLQFKILKGPFANQSVFFKGNFFQDNQSGKWVIGKKSKLAEAIRIITGGAEILNKGHDGTKVLVTVATKVSKTSGNKYSYVTGVIPAPRDYSAPTQPAATPAPQAQVARPAPAAPAQQPTEAPKKSNNLLDELSEFSDFE